MCAFLLLLPVSKTRADLSEQWISYLMIVTDSFKNSNIQYRAFVDSSKTEFDSMLKNHNARALSRIGFVTEDMKRYEYSVINAIQERATEIENNDPDCIMLAQNRLANASFVAGEVIVESAQDWYRELHLLHDEFVTPLLDEIEILMSLLMTETKFAFANLNAVSRFQEIVAMLSLEATLFEILFEIFVNDIIFDFTFFERYTNDKNLRIFRNLDAAFFELQSVGREIELSLSDCV